MLPSSCVILRRTLLSSKNAICRRRISTTHLDPIVQEFTSKIAKKQPVFSLAPRHIQILSQPPEFYSLLLKLIRRAEHRIFISSLYIGSEDTEILNSISSALDKKPSLQVYIQLDLNRSTRPGPSSTANLLLPLLQQYPSRIHVSMFRSPSLRGIMASIVPPRFNEGWGTWHAKIYGVDNEVIISGANLNNSYFTNRQDRYLYFNDQSLLAQYCFDFLQTVTKFSFRLLPASSQDTMTLHSYNQDNYVLQWPDPDTHPHHLNEMARSALTEFQSSRQAASQIQLRTHDSSKLEEQVLIFPIIQAGQFGIREEESTLQSLFQYISASGKQVPRKRPLFDLTSGYFSLYKPYQKFILGTRNIDCRIVASSPKANGFFGSSGISGRIPEGYTYLEKRFMLAVSKAGRLWREAASGNFKGVQLSEWDKPGWTYHAKGIWLSPSSKSLPVLTLFGSTNLNSRSAHLDTELSFVMVVPSRHVNTHSLEGDICGTEKATAPDVSPTAQETSGQNEELKNTALRLRQRLQHEVDNIRANTSTWKGGRRNVRFSTKLIVWLVKGML